MHVHFSSEFAVKLNIRFRHLPQNQNQYNKIYIDPQYCACETFLKQCVSFTFCHIFAYP
jgi:hypothetical protein